MSDSPEIYEVTELRQQLAERDARIMKLEMALTFYADPQTYGLHGGTSDRIMADHGSRATQAIKAAEEAQP